jgi:ESX secretion system protein EccD
MPASDPGLRRVSVHAGTAVVDLALPAAVPLAVLIPSIVDILGDAPPDAGRYHLSRPGEPALVKSKTLADSAIQDGSVLVLGQSPIPPPVARHDDVAAAVTATLKAARPWSRRATRLTGAVATICLTVIGGLALVRNAGDTRDLGSTVAVAAVAGLTALLGAAAAHRAYRDAIAGLTLGVAATAFAAVAGFLAVPGAPGIPNVLLAATAAAVTAELTKRASGCGGVTLTAVACVALVVAVAALVGLLTAVPLNALGAASALISVGLLGVAARVSIVLAGLSPRPADPDDAESEDRCLTTKSIRADNWLAGLLAAFSASAAVGAIITVLAGAPRLCCIGFGTLTGALLLSRARSSDRRRTLVFVVSGIAVITTTFAVTAVRVPGHGPWLAAATATLAAAAIYLGFVAPALTMSPVLRRSAELLECLALAGLVPLTCWICGGYGVVRGMHWA